MAEPEPLPFIAFRQGRARLRVQPRNAQGWQWLIVWMVPLLAMTFSYGFYGASDFAADNRIIWNGGFLIACLIWGVSMSRWTLARAEVIEVPEGYSIRSKGDRDRLIAGQGGERGDRRGGRGV